MSRLNLLLAVLVLTGCTTKYQVRGNETILDAMDHRLMVGRDEDHRARQVSMEHQSIEKYDDFSLGIIEISDEGGINPAQKSMVVDWIEQETEEGGLLVVLVHGWHHGARTCDRDLCCFRNVLAELKRSGAGGNGKVVGLYIGWRGESFAHKGWNVLTLWGRKQVAEHIGRTAGREILLELEEQVWLDRPDLTMVTVGHSLGGAFVYSAVKGQLTGNISDIEQNNVSTYRVMRTEEDRVSALNRNEKARRAGFGDLVVLVNPAMEASEYAPFDADLRDDHLSEDGRRLSHAELVQRDLPYDKYAPYSRYQMPVLVTVASRGDTAVSRFFPPARWVETLLTFRWKHFARAYWTGMGRYQPHVTHRLEGPERYKIDRQPISESCGCPLVTDGLADLSFTGLQLDTVSDQSIGEGVKLSLSDARRKRGWDVNSPYLVIEASEGIISEHNDIFNPVFVGFLQQFLRAYDKKYESLPEAIKK